jgi:hypothetical protein
VQNAKDTFYEMLRARIAAGNAERTVVVRGVTRPGVVVEENELAVSAELLDCFRLRWGKVTTDVRGGLPMVGATCEVEYATAGTSLNTEMDRGRALAAMDGELLAALNAQPQDVLKTNYAGLAFGQSAVAMTTNVWWGDVVFGDVVVDAGQLKRVATVAVMSFQEAGEL